MAKEFNLVLRFEFFLGNAVSPTKACVCSSGEKSKESPGPREIMSGFARFPGRNSKDTEGK